MEEVLSRGTASVLFVERPAWAVVDGRCYGDTLPLCLHADGGGEPVMSQRPGLALLPFTSTANSPRNKGFKGE